MRDAERIDLSPFTSQEVTDYLQELIGRENPNPALCETLHSMSQGNPWFLSETVLALVSDHGLNALATRDPSLVKPAGTAAERVHQRLRALDGSGRAVLELASVLGDGFEIDLLAHCGEIPMDRTLDALEAAHLESLISLDSPRHARFSHGLLRQALYEGLSLAARLEHRHQVAKRLEQVLDPQRYRELAYHCHCALPVADAAMASQAARRAANAAARAHAFAEQPCFWSGSPTPSRTPPW